MAVVTSFSQDQDFWELNPQLLLDPAIKGLHAADKTKGKKSSNALMWWVALCYDLSPENKWRGQALADKGPELWRELGMDPAAFDKRTKELQPVIDAYCKFMDSPAKRQLRMLEQKLEEKTAFMAKTTYDEETYEVLDKMMLSDDKLYGLLAKVTKQLSEETEGQGKGGGVASLSDSGEI